MLNFQHLFDRIRKTAEHRRQFCFSPNVFDKPLPSSSLMIKVIYKSEEVESIEREKSKIVQCFRKTNRLTKHMFIHPLTSRSRDYHFPKYSWAATMKSVSHASKTSENELGPHGFSSTWHESLQPWKAQFQQQYGTRVLTNYTHRPMWSVFE